LPIVAPQTFPDGRLDVVTTNGTMRLSFTRTEEESPFAEYEMIPSETQFTLVESRSGTLRRRTVWTRSGDEWTMEVYDPTVSPMELVERRTRRESPSLSGTVVSETRGGIAMEREYRNLASGGGFIVRETVGSGASARTTWHAPVESGAATGRTHSTVRPDGSWTLYAYDSDGRVASEIEPFGDAAPILDARNAVIGYNSVVRETMYSYSPVDSRDDGSLSPNAARATVVRIGNESEGWTETSRRYYAEYLVSGANSVTQRVVVAERAASAGATYGADSALRTTTWYHWRNANAGRPVLRIADDGLATRWSYSLDGATRTTESFTAPLSATNGIPYKTTVSRSVANLKGDVTREETWIVTDDGRELLSWTDYERDSAGRVVRSESSNGDIDEVQWGCCGEDWTLDAKGILTEYAYDALKRRVSSTCGTVTTLWSYDLSGNATNVTRYGISGQGTALVSSSSSGYDGAGRLAWTIGEDGARTEYQYGVSPEGGEVRTTIRAAGTDCAVTNMVVSYRDGSTKATYLNGVLKSTEVHEPFASTTYEGTNGVDSARWSRSETDFLGRTISESRPGFGGSTLVTSNIYDTAGRLVSTLSLSTRSTRPDSNSNTNTALCVSAPLRETIYLYNELGERVATVSDRNFNNSIDWVGPDLISSNDTRYVSIDGDWWRESRSFSIQGDDSDEAQLTGVSRSRVTGLGEGLASEGVSIDIRGNETTNRTYRARNAAEEINWVKYPTSVTPAVTVSTNGLVSSSKSRTGVTTTFEYDGLQREVSQTDGRGNTTRTVYDPFGRVVSTIDAAGNVTMYAYDVLGRQTSVTDPLGNAVETAYDAEGRVVSQRGATYPVDYSYDEFGDKVSITTYRDLVGRGDPTAPQGDVTRWLRDEATGLVTNKVYADGKGPTYTYTPDGKLATRTWARGIVTTYCYDDNGVLTNTVYSDGTPTISIVYNRAGQQTRAHDAAGVTTFAYDSFGAVTNETVVGVAGTNTIERFYDAFGRDVGYALNGTRQTSLVYDSATARIASMLTGGTGVSPVQGEDVFTWSYLPGSDLKSSLTYPNGLTASWQYDANNQLLQVCNATPTNIISQYVYTYDAAGRRINVSKTGTAFTQADSIAYGYNDKGELTNALAAVDSDYRYAYDFDDIGNRESSSERGTNSVYTANQLNQYTEISDSALSASPRETFTPQFDDDGNQTLIKTATGIWQVQYNGENRPVQWTLINSSTLNSSTPPLISMSYDRMGRRVAKNNQRFVYNGYLQIANFELIATNSQLTTHNSQLFIWDPTKEVATRPLAWSRNGALSFYTHDGNKNVSEVVSSSDAIDAHYEYAPFGAVIVQIGADASENTWRFSSEYAEDDTATVYYNYRHYNPFDGRWQTRDTVSDMLSYCFVENNIATYDILGEKSNKPTWQNNPKLIDIKEIIEPKPIPVHVVKKRIAPTAQLSRAEPYGQLEPPPPHNFLL